MDPRLLLIRPRPQEDELFSCWLTRLAWSNGEKLHVFCRRRLGIRGNPWNHDTDRLADPDTVERAAMAAGLPIERVFGATLAPYEGVVYERHVVAGVPRWIMPIGRYARTHILHGQQYCARCLAEGPVPYFRRSWRLAFNVACARHDTLLRDACWKCGKPVSFHEGDFGQERLRQECPVSFCSHCGADLRSDREAARRQPDPVVLRFQTRLDTAVRDKWAVLWPGRAVHSVVFFEGLHHLLRVLASNGYARSIRECLLARRSKIPFPTPFLTRSARFEDLRTHDRHELMCLLAWIMGGWPGRFLRRMSRGSPFELIPA